MLAFVVKVNQGFLWLMLQPKTTVLSINRALPISPGPASNVNVPTSSSLCCVNVRAPVLLQTARTTVAIQTKTRQSGSYSTLGARDPTLQRQLTLNPVSTETMIIKTFGVKNQGQQVCEVVKVGMNLKNGQSLKMSFLSVPLICEPISNQPVTFVCSNCSQFASLELADPCHGDENLEVDILIGADQYYQLVTGEVIYQHNGPTAIHTKLGWVLSGPVSGMSQKATLVNLVTTHALLVDTHQPQESLDYQLKQFWDLESMGIRPDECSIYDTFEKGILCSGERYQVSLPWKESHLPLPDNYDLALRRLNGG